MAWSTIAPTPAGSRTPGTGSRTTSCATSRRGRVRADLELCLASRRGGRSGLPASAWRAGSRRRPPVRAASAPAASGGGRGRPGSGELHRQSLGGLLGALREQLPHLGVDRCQLGDAVDRRLPLHAEAAGQLGSEAGVVERREGALVALQSSGVEGEPPPARALDLRGDHDVGVELRVAGSAGVLAEHRRRDPLGVDDDHLAVRRDAGDRLAVDELDHRGDGRFVGGDHLLAEPRAARRPRGPTPTSVPSRSRRSRAPTSRRSGGRARWVPDGSRPAITAMNASGSTSPSRPDAAAPRPIHRPGGSPGLEVVPGQLLDVVPPGARRP